MALLTGDSMGEAHDTTEGKEVADPRNIIPWLLTRTHDERFIDNVFVALCDRLRLAGVPVARATLHFRINHPQWMGARILWRTGFAEAEIDTVDYGVENSPEFLMSPIRDLHDGVAEVHQILTVDDPARPYPIFAELRQEGLTDYLAMPLQHTLGKRHAVTFASDAPGGFAPEHLTLLRALVPVLALVSEVRIKNALARTLLRTYVGPHAGEKILAGATRRGSGVTLSAVVMIFDVRNFTEISDLWPRDDVIGMLNQCFDALSEPIERHGGEILKFMGDGLLAVFPLEGEDVCQHAFDALAEVQVAMDRLNQSREAANQPALRYGIGVHCGDVMYGNIGSSSRLDFTVIGPTVNIASRLETLTKTVHRPVLMSEAFIRAGQLETQVEHVGSFPLRGLSQSVDVFAPR
ncbi:adenylate/guanylate cyclase domain-containing protein [Rhizobium straminoryzae]|uniref:Adenylate/guanylate cyclase domain-containing protein n=1 Tax=Rhizobium straminoryzae TaxID=1387186 RepID=A0A549SVX2_9HYPH|nr:adenylate/guanylate cyclase domain-containing protein [Rhizobium straminoryzae]